MVDETRRLEDELLGIIKKLENRINIKIESLISEQEVKFEEIVNQIKSTNTKFDHFIETNEENKLKLEKIENLQKFQSKAKDQLITHEIKLNTLSKDLENTKFKYDKYFIDNLTVPGIIGDYCKYHSLKDYIEVNVKEMASLMKYKEQSDIDLKDYKVKLENLINQFTLSLSQYTSQQIQLINNTKIEFNKKLQFDIEMCNEKIQEVRLENTKTGQDWVLKMEEINNEIDNINKLKNELKQGFDDKVSDIENKFNDVVNNFNGFKSEFLKIKNRFIEMIEFIKDVRFRKNLVDFEGISKREINSLVNKIDFKNNKNVNDENINKELDLNYDIFTGEKEDYEQHEKKLMLIKELQRLKKEEELRQLENEKIVYKENNNNNIEQKPKSNNNIQYNLVNNDNNKSNNLEKMNNSNLSNLRDNINNSNQLINKNNISNTNNNIINEQKNNNSVNEQKNNIINKNKNFINTNEKEKKINEKERKIAFKNRILSENNKPEIEIKKINKDDKSTEINKLDDSTDELKQEFFHTFNNQRLTTSPNFPISRNELKKMVVLSSNNFQKLTQNDNKKMNNIRYTNIKIIPSFNKSMKNEFNRQRFYSSEDYSNNGKEAKIISLKYPDMANKSLGTSIKKDFNEITKYNNINPIKESNDINNNVFPFIQIKDKENNSKNKKKNLNN